MHSRQTDQFQSFSFGSLFSTSRLLPDWRNGLPSDLRTEIPSRSISTPIDEDLLTPEIFPFRSHVKSDEFCLFISNKYSVKCPDFLLPPALRNTSSYQPKAFVLSLSEFCRWLSQIAERQGIIIVPEAAAAKFVIEDSGQVKGVRLRDQGINKAGRKTERYQKGMRVICK